MGTSRLRLVTLSFLEDEVSFLEDEEEEEEEEAWAPHDYAGLLLQQENRRKEIRPWKKNWPHASQYIHSMSQHSMSHNRQKLMPITSKLMYRMEYIHVEQQHTAQVFVR